MRVLTEEGKRVKAIQESYKDSAVPIVPCGQDCNACYRDAPDPEPEDNPTAAEVRRLTLENSLLRGELATLRAHAKLSREG